MRKLDNLDTRNVDAFHIPSDLNLVTSEADRVTPGRASISGVGCIPGRSRSGARGLRLLVGIVLSREKWNRFGLELSNLLSRYKQHQYHGRRRFASSGIRDRRGGQISISLYCLELYGQPLEEHDHTCIMRVIPLLK